MIAIGGYYFDGRSSRMRAAQLRVDANVATLFCEAEEVLGPTPIAQLRIADRLGNIPRCLYLPDGARFETPDNDAIDRLSAAGGRHNLVHQLESRWRYVAVALVAVVVFSWGVVRFAVPKLAEAAAFALPVEVAREIGKGVLEILDDRVLAGSTLDGPTREHIADLVAPLLAQAPAEYRATVILRSGKDSVGANAFALPDGTIVFTDELVRLARHDEELMAVLAHELGHVVGRHGLRQGIQGSALSLLAVVILGDVSSASSLAASVPIVLTQYGYSREHEREADAYAARMLKQNAIPLDRFAAILTRLEQERCEVKRGGCGNGLPAYLSTHPPTEERIRFLRQRL